MTTARTTTAIVALLSLPLEGTATQRAARRLPLERHAEDGAVVPGAAAAHAVQLVGEEEGSTPGPGAEVEPGAAPADAELLSRALRQWQHELCAGVDKLHHGHRWRAQDVQRRSAAVHARKLEQRRRTNGSAGTPGGVEQTNVSNTHAPATREDCIERDAVEPADGPRLP